MLTQRTLASGRLSLADVACRVANAGTMRDLPLPDLLAALQCTDQGLTTQQAQDRLARGQMERGLHLPGRRRRQTAWHEIGRQFASPIIWVLAGTTVLSMALGDPLDGAIILLILVASGVAGFWREHQAGRIMAQLLARIQVQVEVVRDGVVVSVTPDGIVPGDVVILNAGDVIPADLRVLTAHNLLVDESVLTGESEPVERSADQMNGWLRDGTHVVSGTAQAIAVLAGSNSEMGRLRDHLRDSSRPSAFEAGTTRLGLLLLRTMAVLVAVLVVVNLVLQRPIVESLLFALAVAVGLTPQLLPAIVAASMSAGAQRMARKSVLVKQLDAIADFGGMTVLCCDKTGTLTAGSLALNTAMDSMGQSSSRVHWLALTNASLQRGMSNPLDAAIRATAVPGGEPLPGLVDEIPYDFERRRLSILVDAADGPLMITKGAYAEVLQICTQVRLGETLTPLAAERSHLDELFATLSSDGFRVLAVSTKFCPEQRDLDVHDERDMTLEGLLTFYDPLKPDAADALGRLRSLGIRVVLITGDNHLTARYIATGASLPTRQVLLGSDIDAMDQATLTRMVLACDVFAQIDPLQKERIVLALQQTGAVVGLLGDGINDGAALRAANVGISVDTAVDIAREAATLVLLDKDLHVIADGVLAGRTTFANTVKYVRVTMSANFGNMLSLVVATAFLPFLPMLPIQILLLNFLSDIPAFALSDDRVDPESIQKPTRWNIPALRSFMVVFGLASSFFDLALFFVLSRVIVVPAAQFQAAWFAASTLTELAALLVLRTTRPFWRSRASWALLATSGAVAALVLVLVMTPAGATLGLAVLPAALVCVVLGGTAGYVLVNELVKRTWKVSLASQ